ncbi:lipopolysaccharide biosynthesis regulator YciM [Sulfurirhabdus autotrophica]|uniref:Lipopolysaccharide assembly protein B n=2 Tax=Sulfurirhabdus autotrophica TaxID=1706046 RepID=A0A4R3YF40_9PROT|nr:lipopolysaccharide biosynthesis regulator YciM [Sulfurirhabdus autotrophica]
MEAQQTMEFEFWWLLAFPLFFALGWLAARIDIKHVISESSELPESYFKGLNFLLNEQPDQAIEVLSEVVQSEKPEAVELNFALGSLFRRRGEVDRAIRMHKSIVDRSYLSNEQKLAAVFELAQDYKKAGLLDSAEQLFSDLQKTTYSKVALKFLLEIYQQEKDWSKAIQTARQLSTAEHPHRKVISHFYCELAVIESAHSNPEASKAYLEEALKENRRCVRATILMGDQEVALTNHEGAIQIWKRVETQDPRYISLVAGKLLASYRALDKVDLGLALLRGYLAQYPSADLLNIVYQGMLEHQGAENAYRTLRDELRRNPTLQGLTRLLEAQLQDMPVDRQQDLLLIKNLLHQHTRQLAMFRCDSCGFEARQFHWYCPACGGWETFPPRRREETEFGHLLSHA